VKTLKKMMKRRTPSIPLPRVSKITQISLPPPNKILPNLLRQSRIIYSTKSKILPKNYKTVLLALFLNPKPMVSYLKTLPLNLYPQ
jgi:hypothetical protein